MTSDLFKTPAVCGQHPPPLQLRLRLTDVSQNPDFRVQGRQSAAAKYDFTPVCLSRAADCRPYGDVLRQVYY
jgi:hypothetical protein